MRVVRMVMMVVMVVIMVIDGGTICGGGSGTGAEQWLMEMDSD